MLVGAPGRGAAARRSVDEAVLQQVRLVDVLDRVRLLADRRGERDGGGPRGGVARRAAPDFATLDCYLRARAAINDFTLDGASTPATVVDADVVFVGYGISAR